jgi:hypothetical protein
MNHQEFQGMCQLIGDGETIWVENHLNEKKGLAIGCAKDMIEVEVDNHCEKWSPSECTEMTHGFKVKYDEVLKHPHEYDTHLD